MLARRRTSLCPHPSKRRFADSWQLSVGENNGATAQLIAGLISASGEVNGWNRVVKLELDYRHVLRLSDTFLVIEFPMFRG